MRRSLISICYLALSTFIVTGDLLAQSDGNQVDATEEAPASNLKSKIKPKPEVPSSSSRPGKSKAQDVAQVKDSLVATPDQTSWWSPKSMRHSVGVELSDSTFGVLGTDAVAYGFSLENFGIDIYFAYSKDANSAVENVTQTSNDVSTPKTLTINKRYTGVQNPKKTTFGIQPKYIFYSDSWFKTSIGFMLAHASRTSVRYRTGTVTTTYADSSVLSNYSVTESAFGYISSTVSPKIIYGPRLNVEFYLKWFPHIALGFGTGMLLTQGGDVTTSTSTQTRSYTVTDGVAANPTSSQTSSSTDKVKSGGSSRTIAVGGTRFNLMGNFGIRYIW